jgi:predicted O-methyltransferase YrrM
VLEGAGWTAIQPSVGKDPRMPKRWTTPNVLALASGYKVACVLTAAAELELFSVFADKPLSAEEITQELGTDPRATTILLDALAALEILSKRAGRYSAGPTVRRLLAPNSPGSVLAMVQHQANCLRRWARLAQTVKTGQAAERQPSTRGEAADQASFIEAMDNISGPVASELVGQIGLTCFSHLLDVGGASGTWTLAFLRANPEARATVFDLPEVIPLAERRITEAGLIDRVTLVAGDFLGDPLPQGADVVWLSAIVHQNSREQNRRLFSAIREALVDGGQLFIRDVLMDESRTTPLEGALFAVNMLVGTEGGGTFTFEELREDLEAAGFASTSVVRRDPGMNSVVRAVKSPRG